MYTACTLYNLHVFFPSLAFTTSAYVLHRRTREDNPDEHDAWAFDETKTIESLGVTNDGILSVSLRGESLCSHGFVGCVAIGCGSWLRFLVAVLGRGSVVVVVKKTTKGGQRH